MTDLWTTFSTAAPAVMQALMRAEIQLAAMGIMVLLLDRYLVKVDQNYRYLLWLIVLAKALWPPMLYVPVLDVWPTQILTIGLLSPAAEAAPIDGLGPTGINLAATVPLAIWAGLSILLLLIITGQSWSLRRRLATASRPYDAELQKLFPGQEWPSIRVSESIPSPMTVGVFRPRIYLTPEVAAGSRSSPSP